MNKIIFTLILLIALSAAAVAQTFQGTIKPGSQAQSFYLVLKPSANLTDRPSNFQFTLAVPTTVGARPTISLLNNRYSSYFSSVPITQTATYLTDYVYFINFSLTTFQSKTYTANVEDTVAEVLFTGNIGVASTIRLEQLPNGMASSGFGSENGNYNFYIQFATAPGDKTNTTAMFYTTTNGVVVNSPLGYTGLSTVSVGTGALPLKWLDFSVQKQNGNALIKWEVANQVNNAYYEVEVGKDAYSLTTVGKVAANANQNVYTFNDLNINRRQGQYLYYRIKQVDKDGNFTYSTIKKISIFNTEFSFTLINNPVIGNELKVGIESVDNSTGAIKVFDLTGKQVFQTSVSYTSGYSEKVILLSNLAAGSYIATLNTGTEQYSLKFVK